MKVTIISSKKVPGGEPFDIEATATVGDLKKAFKPKVSMHRKAFKLIDPNNTDPKARPPTLEDNNKTLGDYKVSEGTTLQYKDLGPQIGYRTVFVVEYAGPIALMLFYASRPSFIYGAKPYPPFGDIQKMFIVQFLLHFLKREFETFFVHKFSRPTMPLSNIFKNSIYYWAFAAFIGYYLAHPLYTPPTHGLEYIASAWWVTMELGNLMVHLQLGGMRKVEGETSRNVPEGPLFSLVSCPNYTFEVLGWAAFSLGSNIASSWMFTAVGLLQMTDWALKKHKGYIKADPANKKKKSIIPFVI